MKNNRNWNTCFRKGLFCLVVTLIGGCNNVQNTEQDYPTVNPISVTETITEISSYIDKIEIVPLAATDSIVISNITKLLTNDDGDIIILSGSGIYRLDKNGRFQTKFGNVGHGPGEYLKIYDICINNKQTELWGLTHLNQVMKYNLNTGKYIQTVETNCKEIGIPNASGIAPSEQDGFYLFVPNPSDEKDLKQDFYCLIKFDGNGDIIDRSIRRTDFNVNFGFIPAISQSYNNTYLIKPQENENICYKIEDGELSKFCKIHFGNENIPPLYAFKDDLNPWENMQSMMLSDYYKMPFNIHTTKNDLFISAFGSKQNVYNFLIKSDLKQGINWNNGNNMITTPLLIVCSDEEFFYGLFDKYPSNPNSDMKEIDPLLRYLIKEKNLHLDDDENPTIVKIKFK